MRHDILVVEKAWAIAVTAFVTLLCFDAGGSLLHDGLAIDVIRDEYVIRQGITVRSINQTFGHVMYLVDRTLLILAPVAIAMTCVVAYRHQTLRPDAVFKSDASSGPRYVTLLNLNILSVMIVCLVGMVRCVEAVWFRP